MADKMNLNPILILGNLLLMLNPSVLINLHPEIWYEILSRADPISKETICRTCKTFHELLKMLKKKYPPKKITYSQIEKEPRIEFLRWAKEQGCPINPKICYYAAKGGHLEVLRWARENQAPWDERTCSAAAFGGHLEVLRWLRKIEVPWNADICNAAAVSGHFDVLRWARENQAP
jgi:hypothetical protein